MESVHAIAACASDARGRVILALGDIDTPVFLRSTAKPFIAAALVRDGTAAHFDLEPRELAVIAASHGGEPFHVAAVRGILAKIGLGPEALQCGAHPPYYEPAAAALAAAGERPSALHSNCSGKHVGLLASCVAHGEDVASYLDVAHPAQQRVLAYCARLSQEPLATLPLATDGCGIPVYATSLRRAARAFALATGPAGVADTAGAVGVAGAEAEDVAALREVVAAMAAWPAYVAGTGRFDTVLGTVTAGRIVGKAGAEGVQGAFLERERLGLVLKAIDGAARAVPVAALGLLRALGALEPDEEAQLASFSQPRLRNVAGHSVGRLAVRSDTIRSASASVGVPSLPKD